MGKLTIVDIIHTAGMSGVVAVAIGFHIRAASILPSEYWQKTIFIVCVMLAVFVIFFQLMTMRDGLHYDPKASHRYIPEGD